ncbi:MAG: hypothetical protein HKN31_15405 [Pricia sp.]|nr:hypothetical protein [Pricia sp.]
MKPILFLIFFLSCGAQAQNTLSLTENGIPAKADLSEIAWMEGHWKGEAFGGITEEIWSPALGGSMMFSFKLVSDNKVNFYELGHIRQFGETLVYELKHFNTDLKGWEEKDEVKSYKLIKAEGNRLYFEGFTFEQISADEINIYGVMRHKDGTTEEIIFNYTRSN